MFHNKNPNVKRQKISSLVNIEKQNFNLEQQIGDQVENDKNKPEKIENQKIDKNVTITSTTACHVESQYLHPILQPEPRYPGTMQPLVEVTHLNYFPSDISSSNDFKLEDLSFITGQASNLIKNYEVAKLHPYSFCDEVTSDPYLINQIDATICQDHVTPRKETRTLLPKECSSTLSPQQYSSYTSPTTTSSSSSPILLVGSTIPVMYSQMDNYGVPTQTLRKSNGVVTFSENHHNPDVSNSSVTTAQRKYIDDNNLSQTHSFINSNASDAFSRNSTLNHYIKCPFRGDRKCSNNCHDLCQNTANSLSEQIPNFQNQHTNTIDENISMCTNETCQNPYCANKYKHSDHFSTPMYEKLSNQNTKLCSDRTCVNHLCKENKNEETYRSNRSNTTLGRTVPTKGCCNPLCINNSQTQSRNQNIITAYDREYNYKSSQNSICNCKHNPQRSQTYINTSEKNLVPRRRKKLRSGEGCFLCRTFRKILPPIYPCNCEQLKNADNLYFNNCPNKWDHYESEPMTQEETCAGMCDNVDCPILAPNFPSKLRCPKLIKCKRTCFSTPRIGRVSCTVKPWIKEKIIKRCPPSIRKKRICFNPDHSTAKNYTRCFSTLTMCGPDNLLICNSDEADSEPEDFKCGPIYHPRFNQKNQALFMNVGDDGQEQKYYFFKNNKCICNCPRCEYLREHPYVSPKACCYENSSEEEEVYFTPCKKQSKKNKTCVKKVPKTILKNCCKPNINENWAPPCTNQTCKNYDCPYKSTKKRNNCKRFSKKSANCYCPWESYQEYACEENCINIYKLFNTIQNILKILLVELSKNDNMLSLLILGLLGYYILYLLGVTQCGPRKYYYIKDRRGIFC